MLPVTCGAGMDITDILKMSESGPAQGQWPLQLKSETLQLK